MFRDRSWRRWMWALPAAAMLLALLACSGGSSDGAEPTAAPPEPTQAASEPLVRPTPTESVEETGGIEGDAGAGEAYSEYVAVVDDTGAIQVEVPSSWSDIDGAPWTTDDGIDFASIYAAPDLQEFMDNWGTPGMQFNVTAEKEKIGGHIQVLDGTRAWDLLKDCELDSRNDYDDGYYRGAYDYYEDCGDLADYMILAAVPKQGGEDVLILLEVQIVTNADIEVAEHILATFDIVGSLP